MDLRNGALEIYGLIKIKNSEINITLDGAGVPSYQFALQTHSGGGTYTNPNIGLTVEGSKITIDSKANGISAPPQCDFTDSEVEVRIPYSSDTTNKAISTNYDKIHVVRSTVKAVGGGGPVVLPGYDFSVDSNSDFWNELDQSIYVAGAVNITPETSDKQLVVHENSSLTIENGAAFDTMLYNGTVFTAANVKNLSICNSGNAKILLTDEIPFITVSGDIANTGWFTLEYEGTEPKSPVVLTAKSAEDAARIRFDTDRFELKDSQIVWKQTPLAAPTGLSWDGAKAQWTPVANARGYTVQLYKDNAAFGAPVTVTSAAEYDFTALFTETGSYTFGGWFTDEACTAAYDFSTPVSENMILYAKWTKESAGGGSGSGGASSSGSSTPSLPVTTTGQNSSAVTTTTTAAPTASTKGGTATVAVDTSMGNEIVKQAVATTARR